MYSYGVEEWLNCHSRRWWRDRVGWSGGAGGDGRDRNSHGNERWRRCSGGLRAEVMVVKGLW